MTKPLDLLQGGLPDVDDGQAVTMGALDLVGDAHCAPPRGMDRGHDRGPPERERSPADAMRVGRAERRGAGALRPAIAPRSIRHTPQFAPITDGALTFIGGAGVFGPSRRRFSIYSEAQVR